MNISAANKFFDKRIVSFDRFASIDLDQVVRSSSSDSERLRADVFATTFPHDMIAMLNIKLSGNTFLRELMTLQK